MKHIIPLIIHPVSNFGLKLRELVVATLSLGIVGVAVYAILFQPNSRTTDELAAWAGMIVGVYFGGRAPTPFPPNEPPASRERSTIG